MKGPDHSIFQQSNCVGKSLYRGVAAIVTIVTGNESKYFSIMIPLWHFNRSSTHTDNNACHQFIFVQAPYFNAHSILAIMRLVTLKW